jgi:hypothetical protein
MIKKNEELKEKLTSRQQGCRRSRGNWTRDEPWDFD